MRVVMTLLARDEADLIDAQLAFHLNAGIDFVVATDNRSEDGTTEILERYERAGVLHLIREPGRDLRQSEWVTRMARLAATEFGADWVLNSDADEFWWPRGRSFADVLAAVPERYGAVRGAWRNFVPRPDDEPFFAERMTVRLCDPTYLDHPLATVFKSAHRAAPDVRIGRGNHEAFADGLFPLRGWYPIEIFHFPVRSLEQCRRKYVTQFVALERNAEKGIPGQIAEAYDASLAGRLVDFYVPLVVDDIELERGLANGRYSVDTRLRDVLRALRSDGRAEPGFVLPDERAASLTFDRLGVEDGALFASEVSVIPESDLAQALGERVEDLEARIGGLEHRAWRPRQLATLARRYRPAP